MPQLNRDILWEVFYEIANTDGFGSSMDKFMMAGKEPFNLVLNVCRKAEDVVIDAHRIYAKLVAGTHIRADMMLFKPISIAVASTLTSLDIRGYSPKFIPMLKSIDQEMEKVIVRDYNRQLKHILKSCTNISNVRNGVTIDVYGNTCEMKFFAIPCLKLTIKDWFSEIYKEMNLDNPYLRQNIHDLTIEGTFYMSYSPFHQELNRFATFLSINFPNLETLNVMFKRQSFHTCKNKFWDWNGIEEMANQFKGLPPRMKGCICFKMINREIVHVNLTQYPGVQRSNDEYYKIVPINDTLTFKMSYWYNVGQH